MRYFIYAEPNVILFSGLVSEVYSIPFFLAINFAVLGNSCISPTAPTEDVAVSLKWLSQFITLVTRLGEMANFIDTDFM